MRPIRRLQFTGWRKPHPTLIYSLMVIFLVLLLSIFLFEPVRRYLTLPLEFIAWLLKSIYLLIPRQVLWLIFLVLAYWIAFSSLQNRARSAPDKYSPLPELFGEPKIARMARYIAQSYRPFFHHRLNHLLTELSLQVLAYRLQLSHHQARSLLAKDRLDLPKELLGYFKMGLSPWPLPLEQPRNLWERWMAGRFSKVKAVEEAEKALDFLEAYLEVPREY